MATKTKRIQERQFEFQLMTQAMLPGNIVQLAKTLEGIGNFNDDEFLHLCEIHRCYPLVYKNLLQTNAEEILPYVMAQLKTMVAQNTLLAMLMARETLKIIQTLREHKINATVIKGTPLAQLLYNDVGARASVDVDLVIKPRDMSAVQTILAGQLGYTILDFQERPAKTFLSVDLIPGHHLIARQEFGLEEFTKTAPRSVEICHNFHLDLELHWNFDLYGYAEECLWQNEIEDSKFLNGTIQLLKEKTMFCYLLAHGSRHGWLQLRWLADLIVFIETKQPFFEEKSDSLQAKHLGAAMILAEKYFSWQPPGYLLKYKANRYAVRQASHIPALDKSYAFRKRKMSAFTVDYWRVFYYVYFLTRGHFDWPEFKLLFQPKSWDIETIRLPAKLFFLYFPLRLCFCLCRNLQRLVDKSNK